MNGLNNGL